MLMKIQLTKNFETRSELDDYVRVTFGEDLEKNKGVILELSTEEMEKLSLSESTTVHGTKIRSSIIETDVKTNENLPR